MSIESELNNPTEDISPSALNAGPENVSTSAHERLDELIRVLKVGSCSSLTGLSTLGYQFGCKGESELYLRLTSNTGSGFFSKEWIPCSLLEQFVSNKTELTSGSFKALFPNKSVNTGGFVMAVLKDLGLLQVNADNSRWHEHVAGMKLEQLATAAIVQEEETQKEVGSKGKRKPKEA